MRRTIVMTAVLFGCAMIVFAPQAEQNWKRLKTVRPAGAAPGAPAPRQITFSPDNESWPVWDPAGDRVAYLIGSSNRGFSTPGSGGDIGLAAADGSAEMVAAAGPTSGPFGLAVSPTWVGNTGRLMIGEKIDLHEYLTFDTTRAPFIREVREGGDEAFTLELVAAPEPGRPGLGSGDGVAVSRDGSTVAWRISRNAACGMTEIRVAPLSQLTGQFAHEVGTVVLDGECEFPDRPLFVDGFSLTPDGSQLVISLPPAGNTENTPPLDLYLYNTDGSGLVRRLTAAGGGEDTQNRFPDVSPDGTQVLFIRSGQTAVDSGIYSIRLDGAGLTQLTDRGFEASWSPDGRSIAFSDVSREEDPPNANIFVLSLSGEPGPFVPPAPDLETLRQAFVDSNFNDIPEPGVDGRLIFEREGNVIRLFEAANPDRVWTVTCGDPHPLTGRPQSCAVEPPEFPAPTSLWKRLTRAFFRTVMGIDAERHTISADRFDPSLRVQSLVIESRIDGEDVRLTTLSMVDEDQDGVTDSFDADGFLFLPMFQPFPLLADVTDDGNPDYAGWPITIEGGRYFLPLGDSNGDGVPDTTLADFDRDGRLDPDVPLIFEFLTGPPPGPAQLRLQFAHFGDGEGPPGSRLSSQIALFNPDSAQPVDAEVSIRGDDGLPLQVDLNGVQVNGTRIVRVPAGGATLLRTDGMGEVNAGSVTVTSARAVGGNILFGGTTGVAGVGVSHVMAGGFSAFMERNEPGRINAGVAVRNLEETEAPLRFRLLDEQGALLAESEIDPLPPGGHRALFVTQFPWETPDGEPLDFSDFRGILEAETEGRLAATVLQTRPGELATLPVAPLIAGRNRAAASRRGSSHPKGEPGGDLFQKLYFAQFGDGELRDAGGQVLADFFSQIVLLNLGSEQATVQLLLRDDDGNPLTVDLNGEQVEGVHDLTIPAGGLQVLQTDGLGDLVAGSVVVCSDQFLAGTILFGGSAGTAGVGAGSLLRNGFLAPVEGLADGSLRTGVAVMNLRPETLRLDVRVRDSDGATLATAVLELPPLGHRALFVDQLTEALDGLDFEGVLEATGEGKYAATVLRTTAGIFATQPVMPSLQ